MFPPHVVALEIVLPGPCPHSNVVHCLLVDQLDLLVLRKQGREPLENFLSRQSWEGSSKSILLQEIRTVDDRQLFLGRLGSCRYRLFHLRALTADLQSLS